ncbi:hypothetical protein [Candidatus Protochlamydia amoebophila]|uniref:Uncharacterized protein n=1 Tax=Candidatus Protochlamydia amoebophila TaxID=362787 RepID=A0A0C1JKN9_9BACT|nr:hypothetical protein [Candidatus Protochlamydia amoebophila]KIC71126.1 hypothetical protein DB44_ER00550 [Candidatus Protochlamydia amoebophila]
MSIHSSPLSPSMCSFDYPLANPVRKIVTNSRLVGVQKKVSKLTKRPTQPESISTIQIMQNLIKEHEARVQEHEARVQEHEARMQKLMDDHEQFLRDFRPPPRKVKESLNTNAELDQQAVVEKETDNISSFTNSIIQENIAKPSWWETALKIIHTLISDLFSFVRLK